MNNSRTISTLKQNLGYTRLPLIIFILLCLGMLLLIFSPFVYTNAIYELYGDNTIIDNTSGSPKVALILGAGVRRKYPTPVLQKRLDTGAQLYVNGQVEKLLVSGSNDSIYYDEPTAMKSYLETVHNIPSGDIIQDFGGVRTFDSCKRAKEVFKATHIVIVTQRFHMHRAFFLCDQMNFDTLETKLAPDSSQQGAFNGYIREIPATWQAIFDIISGRSAQFDSDGSEQIIY